MKKIILATVLAFVAFTNFAQKNAKLEAVSGTYTIGGTAPDFSTLTDAMNDIDALGISGNVVFHIRSGSF
jgi:uncharacterized protein YdeI (BOF family)